MNALVHYLLLARPAEGIQRHDTDFVGVTSVGTALKEKLYDLRDVLAKKGNLLPRGSA